MLLLGSGSTKRDGERSDFSALRWLARTQETSSSRSAPLAKRQEREITEHPDAIWRCKRCNALWSIDLLAPLPLQLRCVSIFSSDRPIVWDSSITMVAAPFLSLSLSFSFVTCLSVYSARIILCSCKDATPHPAVLPSRKTGREIRLTKRKELVSRPSLKRWLQRINRNLCLESS